MKKKFVALGLVISTIAIAVCGCGTYNENTEHSMRIKCKRFWN